MNATKRIVGYLRVSTDRQELGPVAQRQQIEAFAAREGLELVGWFEDIGVSGAADLSKRVGLMGALDACTELRADLCVAKRDRLSRDTLNALLIERQLAKSGCAVVSADGLGNGADASATLLRGILDSVAQFERAQIRARTKAARQVQIARKAYGGGAVPTGYTLEGSHLIANATEQATVARVKALAAEGHSQREIVALLAAEGHVNRQGRPHVRNAVARMLAA